jgi:hypothetical protein
MMYSRPGEVRQGDVITAALLNELAMQRMAPGIRSSGGISSRQTSDGQIQVWGTPSGGVFECMPSALVPGATGTWPNLTLVSFTVDVYQAVSGSLTLIVSSATVWNGLPASLAASKVCYCLPDSFGDYVVISQSCT